MITKDEKILLLSGIEKIKREMIECPSVDTLDRYLNLTDCLIKLNWSEVERRERNR
jgi:hypothetical protein